MLNVAKKLLIGISVLLNIGIAYIVIMLANGHVHAVMLGFMVEPNYQRWVSQFEMFPVQEGDVVFLGDSITEGGSWHEIFPGVPVRNRGIGGDITSGVLARLDQVAAGKPSKVFLMIGTNDLTIDESEEMIVQNILSIVDGIHAESPETQVFVQSVLPRGEGYRELVESLNQKLYQAIEGRAQWVDLYPLMLDEDGSINDSYSNDELHLYGAGYRVWADAIKHLVQGNRGA